MKEPSLENLIADLNSLISMKNPRFEILGLQLYLEHFVNEIVLEQVGEPVKKEMRNMNFPSKLKILEKMGAIKKEHKKVLEALASIRNELVHNLVISLPEIERKLDSVKLGFKYKLNLNINGKKDSIDIDLPKELKKIKSKFEQLRISTVVLIAHLYYVLNGMRKKQVTQFLDVQFSKGLAQLVLREVKSKV